ncbi:MAG: glutaredoxin 3 [Desulfobacteraceae bacterium]|nr:glutaredoxin 3 [Desulfobacteraceae bacterium]MCF8095964.1 glutaredoxin 3 [Desulfobacteraceae bacterium]
MSEIEIYTTRSCPYCIMAKSLLDKKDAGYKEIAVDGDSEKMAEAVKRSGGRKTVPQIFIDDQHIGGYDELNSLEEKGRLDQMLGHDS